MTTADDLEREVTRLTAIVKETREALWMAGEKPDEALPERAREKYAKLNWLIDVMDAADALRAEEKRANSVLRAYGRGQELLAAYDRVRGAR